MIPRQLEPEVMDTVAEALDYDTMDHAAVNARFVDDLLAVVSLGTPVDRERIQTLDVGTGTAQIPMELCRRTPAYDVVAIDLAAEMLKVGAKNVAAAGLGDRIRLERIDAKQLPWDDARFDVVMSNSIVHHIPDPIVSIREMFRVLRPGGCIFVRDLMRPESAQQVDQFVAQYAGKENAHQQQMFRDSLHAALTVSEVQEILREIGQDPGYVSPTSDRHWTLAAQL